MQNHYRTKIAFLKWIAILVVSVSLSACTASSTSIENIIDMKIEVTVTTNDNERHTGFLIDKTDSQIRLLVGKEIKTYQMADVKTVTYNNRVNVKPETIDALTSYKLDAISQDVEETKAKVNFLYTWTLLNIAVSAVAGIVYWMSL